MSTSENQHYQALASQVGGHPGVMTSEDGSLVIKPVMPAEVEFYQLIQSDPALELLRPFVPKFYGTLRLEGQVDKEKSADGGIVLKEGSTHEIKDVEKDEYTTRITPRCIHLTCGDTQSIVLENLSHKFSKPNIMDIKLGTVLYEKTATAEKRARMEKTARETTSFETGVRLTGFQVYDVHKNVPVNTPKSYGKSIKPADLPDGVARFFPMPSSDSEARLVSDPASEKEAAGTGLPADILLPILQSIREDVAEIKQALEQIPVHMVGSSVLIVYEADWDRAREGLKYWIEGQGAEDEEDDDEDSDEEGGRPGPPYVVKLIDFAHTHLVPEEGPDEGVIFGVETVLKLLDGRIEQVTAVSSGAT